MEPAEVPRRIKILRDHIPSLSPSAAAALVRMIDGDGTNERTVTAKLEIADTNGIMHNISIDRDHPEDMSPMDFCLLWNACDADAEFFGHITGFHRTEASRVASRYRRSWGIELKKGSRRTNFREMEGVRSAINPEKPPVHDRKDGVVPSTSNGKNLEAEV